jgi:hypothetical protein
MAFEFFRPTSAKVGAAFAASTSALAYCLTSEAPVPKAFLFSVLLTGNSFMYGAYYAITNYPQYFQMPAFVQRMMRGPSS